MSGYDIKKHVQAVLGTVAHASYGTLYPTLHRLLAEGAVEMQEFPQKGRPVKKLYNITTKGRTELHEWLKRPPAADQIRREFLLKLYLASHLTPQDVIVLLASRRGETEAAVDALRTEHASTSDPKRAWVINYELTLCEAEIDWLNQMESQIGTE